MRISFFISLFLFFAIVAKAQQPFTRDVWLNESNTAVKVNDMVQDAKGYIWLGTDAGLCRFNGRTVTLIEDSTGKPVTAVCMFRGAVWVGYNDGRLGYVSGNKVLASPVAGKDSLSGITSLYAGHGGLLWLATGGNGIAVKLGNRLAVLDAGAGLSDNFVYKLSSPDGKKILACTDRGLNSISMQNGKPAIKQFTTADGLPDNIVRVLTRIPDSSVYWLGMQQGGVALYYSRNDYITRPRMATTWQWGQVNDILVISPGRAWIATEQGDLLETQLYNNGDSMAVHVVHMDGKRIYKLLYGRSGIIWCATNQGITMVTAEYMNAVHMQQPFSINAIRAMACDRNNMLWFSQGEVLYNIPLPATGAPKVMAKLPADVSSLFADDDGRMWIGTLGKGLWLRDATGGLKNITGIEQLKDESILDIAGTNNRIWVSGLNGVEELTYPGAYTQTIELVKHHDKHSGIGSDYVYQVYPDSKGRIWMATDGAGVCMYSNGVYRKWDTAEGMRSKVAYNITEDAAGNIWAATLDNGVCRYNGLRWEEIGRAQGLQDINISTIAANGTGQLVVVHAKGIDVWYPGSSQFRSYSPRQGLGIDSVSSVVLKLFATDKTGNVYIPFQSGFIVFKNIDDYYDIRPLVNIRSVSASFKEMPQERHVFDHDENYLSFRYEGINFANPERLHYRYKLEGYNNNWTVTNDESATFAQLPDGDYTFRVQASLNNNFNDTGGAVYQFTINKPYWKKGWFIFCVTVLLLGMGYTYLRLRESNLRKVSLLQRERMMFEYEHLKSQVNPHFLFNSLNTLTSLIDENAEAAMNYTERLSDLYRNMLAYRDKDLILLQEEWEILDNYMYIQKTRFGDALRLDVQVPEEYMRTRKIVPLALQLLVENAIKHNIVSRSKPLTITIKVNATSIIVSNPVQAKISKEKGSGLGLINIRKRYGLLSKKNIIFGIENNHYIVILPLL